MYVYIHAIFVDGYKKNASTSDRYDDSIMKGLNINQGFTNQGFEGRESLFAMREKDHKNLVRISISSKYEHR